MQNFSSLKKRIKKNEGYCNSFYKDQLGFLTIGYGHLIKKNEKFLLKKVFSKTYLENIFNSDFNKAVKHFYKNYKNEHFAKNTKEVLIEMIFQLGIKKQKKFTKMNRFIKKKLFFMAALEMMDSLWYKQTPNRVDKLIKILLKKEYEKNR